MTPVYETHFSLRNGFAINAGGYTDLTSQTTDAGGNLILPVACNQIIVYNYSAVDVTMRTNPAIAGSQITIAAGSNWVIGTPQPRNVPPRFPLGFNDAVASFESTSGNVNLLVECVP